MQWQALTPEQEEQAQEFARTHAPDIRWWAMYHPVYREVWRGFFGSGWSEFLASKPMAKIPGIHDRLPPADITHWWVWDSPDKGESPNDGGRPVKRPVKPKAPSGGQRVDSAFLTALKGGQS